MEKAKQTSNPPSFDSATKVIVHLPLPSKTDILSKELNQIYTEKDKGKISKISENPYKNLFANVWHLLCILYICM